MRKHRWVAALAAVGVLLSGCASGSEAEMGPPSASRAPQPLPDAELAAFGRGAPLDLGSLRGPAVVNLWAYWCTPCREELPYYQAFSEAHAGRVQVIGVNWKETSTAKARQLVRETGVTYPLYADPDAVLRGYALPRLLLVDADGEVSYAEYVEIESVAQLEGIVREHLPGALT